MNLKKIFLLSVLFVFFFGIAVILSDLQEKKDGSKPVTPVDEKPVEIGEIKGVFTSKKVFSNIDAYASEISSKKPEEAILKLAEIKTNDKTSTEVTIYNQNIALVKELRKLQLVNGLNLVKYEDIAEQIKPETVLFKDLSDPDTFVVEQNYQFDLASTENILKRYLGKTITAVSEKGESFTGKLLSSKKSIVLETSNGIVTLNKTGFLKFPELPEGLLTKPTLVWQLFTKQPGEHETQTSYLTNGVNWNADYIAEVSKNEKTVNLKGWVTITNTSGTSYPNAKLKLVAGDIKLVSQTPVKLFPQLYEQSISYGKASPEQFKQEALFEYHLYSLQRNTTIKNNEKKQISLMSASSIPTSKKYVFDDWKDNKKVQTILEIENKKDKGLGIPLPKGIVRAYKADSDGQLQFLGEDSIDHTPENKKIGLFLGFAFDLTAEKKQVNYKTIGSDCVERDIQVTLKNAKETATEIETIEHVSGETKITRSDITPEKKDAFTYKFKAIVPEKGEKTFNYTVRSCKNNKYFYS